jgi:hypothetical protein
MKLLKNIGYVVLVGIIIIMPWWLLFFGFIWLIQNKK